MSPIRRTHRVVLVIAISSEDAVVILIVLIA